MIKKSLILFLATVSFVFIAAQARAEEDFFAAMAAEAGTTTTTPTEPASVVVSSTQVSPGLEAIIPVVKTIDEPMIRVALWKTNETIKFESPFTYEVYAGEELKGSLSANELATIKYKSEYYYVDSDSVSFKSEDFPRFVPVDQGSYFLIKNLSRKTSTKSKFNYNAYRGEMIYRYSAKQKNSFVINKLPLDQYVAGIAEAPNEAPTEYLRALLVAARSYGYFYTNFGDKTKNLFDVYASTIDQLYLGYFSETMRPKVAQAAADTYGQMVVFDGKPVIAPYFGHSNGKTLTWKSVWGGQDKPWLKPVECLYDKGMKKWGHGVGMSTNDALKKAGKDGWDYNKLLSYYYTDTMVERIY